MPVQFKSPRDRDSHIELTPLIDVVFQLLVFFMLSSQFLDPALQIKLPSLDSEALPKVAPLIIHADSEGNIHLQDEAVPTGQLEIVLRKALEDQGEQAVFLRGDADLPYQEVLKIMQSAARAGAADFNFIYMQE